MHVRLPRHAATAIAIVLTAVLTAGGPSLAAAVFDATNADKVDGRHAIAATSTASSRAGKLVAANSAGMLPNNIIAKAPDADRVDGLDSASLQRRVSGTCASGSMVSGVNANGTVTCATDDDTVDGGDAATLDGQDSSIFQKRVIGTCAVGTMVTGINADGTVACAADATDGGNAAELDGLDSAAFARAYRRTVMVSPAGSAVQNGAALLAAINGIPSSGSNAPSLSSPWLVRLEPGVYDLDGSRLVMRPHVDLAGSGRATKITCACGDWNAAIVAAARSEISSMTVASSGTVATTVALQIPPSANGVKVSDVTLVASATTGYVMGLYTEGSDAAFHDVDVKADGAGNVVGMMLDAGSAVVRGARVTVLGNGPEGIRVEGGTHRVREAEVHSAASGLAYGVVLQAGELLVEETTAHANGTGGSVAAFSTGALDVDRSSLTAATGGTAIQVHGGLTRIGGSKLGGTTSVQSPGGVQCAATYRVPAYMMTNAACG